MFNRKQWAAVWNAQCLTRWITDGFIFLLYQRKASWNKHEMRCVLLEKLSPWISNLVKMGWAVGPRGPRSSGVQCEVSVWSPHHGFSIMIKPHNWNCGKSSTGCTMYEVWHPKIVGDGVMNKTRGRFKIKIICSYLDSGSHSQKQASWTRWLGITPSDA